jgi:hypothetical protein
MNRIYTLTENFLKKSFILKERIGTRFIRFFENKPTPLGRWNLVYDDRLSHRVERANEDHCGPCGELYVKQRTNQNIPRVTKVYERNQEV